MDERTSEIITVCTAIIDAIESATLSLSRVALKARRLAQLLDDDMAFMWLSLECSGADGASPPTRGWKDSGDSVMKGYEKYVKLHAIPDLARLSLQDLSERAVRGALPDKSRVAGAPLAELEAAREGMSKEDKEEIAAQPGGRDVLATATAWDYERRKVLERVAAAIHEWATNVSIVHTFRQLAGNIFDRFKTQADAVLVRVCPDAIAKLNHAVERAGSENAEDWAAAALSCRRVLKDFADAVYPARDEKMSGRSVGEAEYKNRLWAFAKERGGQLIAKEFLAPEEIHGLCKTLDQVYDLDSKGVHDSVTKQEAHLAVMRTYILLEQLGQLVGEEKHLPDP